MSERVFIAERFVVQAMLRNAPVLIVIRAYLNGRRVRAIRSVVVRTPGNKQLPRVTIGRGTVRELMADYVRNYRPAKTPRILRSKL